MKRMTSLSKISRKLLKPFRGKESGMAFTAVLAFMVLGALIITPLLGFMITGLRAGQASESRTQEFYSADAGIQYAIGHLNYGELLEEEYVWPVDPDDGKWRVHLTENGPLGINNDLVEVWVENVKEEGLIFKITSRATDIHSGAATEVVAHVAATLVHARNFFANSMTSVGDIKLNAAMGPNNDIFIDGPVECGGTFTVPPNFVVYGDVKCFELDNQGIIYGDVVCNKLVNKGKIYGNVYYYTHDNKTVIGEIHPGPGAKQLEEEPDFSYIGLVWPDGDTLAKYYYDKVMVNPYYLTADYSTSGNLPPLAEYTGALRDGNLTINSVIDIKLTNTVYIAGDLSVKKATIDLNGQTIFVEGDIKLFGGNDACSIKGSGVILALGQIDFQPNIEAGGDSSLEGIIIRYDNGAWSTVDNYAIGDLGGIHGSEADNVYAVGHRGLVIRHDGTVWSDRISTGTKLDDPTTAPNLNDVWVSAATGDVFAVGDYGSVLRFARADNEWTYGTLAHDTLGVVNLNSVWGIESDGTVHVYAVGDRGAIFKWDGDWQSMLSGTPHSLNGVWGYESTIFAVGDGGTVRKWTEATGWVDFGSATTQRLNAVWGISTTDLYVVGDGGALYRYDGSWRQHQIYQGPQRVFPELTAIWGLPGGTVYAVGEQGSVVRYRGSGIFWDRIPNAELISGTPSDEQIPTTRKLNGVWGSSPQDIIAVGQSIRDFVFVQSVNSFVNLQPGGEFYGSVAGSASAELKRGRIMSPSDLGALGIPQERVMRIQDYIIRQL